jgi:hypothetical protein
VPFSLCALHLLASAQYDVWSGKSRTGYSLLACPFTLSTRGNIWLNPVDLAALDNRSNSAHTRAPPLSGGVSSTDCDSSVAAPAKRSSPAAPPGHRSPVACHSPPPLQRALSPPLLSSTVKFSDTPLLDSPPATRLPTAFLPASPSQPPRRRDPALIITTHTATSTTTTLADTTTANPETTTTRNAPTVNAPTATAPTPASPPANSDEELFAKVNQLLWRVSSQLSIRPTSAAVSMSTAASGNSSAAPTVAASPTATTSTPLASASTPSATSTTDSITFEDLLRAARSSRSSTLSSSYAGFATDEEEFSGGGGACGHRSGSSSNSDDDHVEPTEQRPPALLGRHDDPVDPDSDAEFYVRMEERALRAEALFGRVDSLLHRVSLPLSPAAASPSPHRSLVVTHTLAQPSSQPQLEVPQAHEHHPHRRSRRKSITKLVSRPGKGSRHRSRSRSRSKRQQQQRRRHRGKKHRASHRFRLASPLAASPHPPPPTAEHDDSEHEQLSERATQLLLGVDALLAKANLVQQTARDRAGQTSDSIFEFSPAISEIVTTTTGASSPPPSDSDEEEEEEEEEEDDDDDVFPEPQHAQTPLLDSATAPPQQLSLPEHRWAGAPGAYSSSGGVGELESDSASSDTDSEPGSELESDSDSNDCDLVAVSARPSRSRLCAAGSSSSIQEEVREIMPLLNHLTDVNQSLSQPRREMLLQRLTSLSELHSLLNKE